MVKPGPTVPLRVFADELPNAADATSSDAETTRTARTVFINDLSLGFSRSVRRGAGAGSDRVASRKGPPEPPPCSSFRSSSATRLRRRGQALVAALSLLDREAPVHRG